MQEFASTSSSHDRVEEAENSAKDVEGANTCAEPVAECASFTPGVEEANSDALDAGESDVINDPDLPRSSEGIEDCRNCTLLTNENRKLKNQVKTLQGKLSDHRKAKKAMKRKLGK